MTNLERKKFHPGFYLSQDLAALEMQPAEFAKRSGISEKQLSELLNQKISVTQPIAERLSQFFGNSIQLWLGLQMDFDCYQKSQEMRKAFAEDYQLLMQIEKSFRDRFVLTLPSKDKDEEVAEARRVLQVSSLSLLKRPDLYAIYKEVRNQVPEAFFKNVWLTLAIAQAKEESDLVFHGDILAEKIQNFRSYTRESPADFYPKLKRDFADAGIHFVCLPYLSQSNLFGATKWIDSAQAPVIALSNRGHSNDVFWFSLFHEVAHVRMGHKKNLLENTSDNAKEDFELLADHEAADLLIPKAAWSRFISQDFFDKESIIAFADSQNIHPAIVVGRLQKEERLSPACFNDLKTQYCLEDFPLD